MSYTNTIQCRKINDGVVLVVVVQEGNIIVFGGPAAWAMRSPFYGFLSKQVLLLKLRQHQVIVFATGPAFATAVPETDFFVADVTQAELAHRHHLVGQWTSLGTFLGPLSSFTNSSSFSLNQRVNDLLQLTLCESLEHVHDWRWDKRRLSELSNVLYIYFQYTFQN